jgi:ABC-2 type transport system ATP-binding protein
MAYILEARDLTKYFRHQWTYRRICTLEGLNLQVEEHEIFGMIGHNGAGKTTTFKLLLGLLRPSRGSVTFCGRPLTAEARAAIGFLPEQPYFYDHLTVEETLDFYGALCGLNRTKRRQRVSEVMELVQIAGKRRASLRTLSKGMLQRLGIAQAIINQPRLVILDEPMSGLDPAGRHHMRELVRNLHQEGATVIFSSHILPDAEALCHRVGIIAGGRLRDVVPLKRDDTPEAYLMSITGVDSSTIEALGRIADRPPEANGGNWLIRLSGSGAVRNALDTVRNDNGLVESLTPVHPSLEERFLACAGDVAAIE